MGRLRPEMRALLHDGGLRYDPHYRSPRPEAREALVRVRLAGICSTDLEILRGYMSFQGVLGHEFVGEIEELGQDVPSGAPLWVGQRVVGDINAACYLCPTCLTGRHSHCPNRTTLGIYGRDGAFADYLCLPWPNLHPVSDAVADEQAVFAEPLAAACEILEQVAIRPSDRVAVLGDGRLGLLVTAVLRLTGADVTVVGRHPAKLRLAADWGIPTLLADQPWSGPQAEVVVECTGSPDGFAAARRILRPRGALVLKSTYHGVLPIDMSALVVDEISIIGSRCGPLPAALRLLEKGVVDPLPMISATYSLSDGCVGLDRAAQPGVLKILLRP